MAHRAFRDSVTSRFTWLAPALGFAFLSACSTGGGGGGSAASSRPVDPYCPYVAAPRSFSSAVTVSGKALYEYRENGNGNVSDGQHNLVPTGSTSGQSYAVTINGTAKTWACNQATCNATAATAALVSVINADSSLPAKASGTTSVTLTPKVEGNALTLTSLTRLSETVHQEPRPIRSAEVRVTDAAGTIIQCGETDTSGNFSVSLPANVGNVTVAVAARASNNNNNAYILTNPTDNNFYQITRALGTSGNTANVRLIAKATGSLEGGAFNILDQINNAQSYLRTVTASCNVGASANFFPDCTPVTTIPNIHVYWTPGLTPGVYVGVSGPISFYLNGKAELYILGGLNGDTDVSDMDHYDNSVIIHEYGHFIEDQFAAPNSPGGSHNGNSIIDPRLAWGEGWADFFQAAVTQNPVYRDTYGHVGCTPPSGSSGPCTGVSFDEDLDPTGGSYDDQPTASSPGEGNFHEFAITRTLWDVIKTSGGVTNSGFAEIWAALHGATRGMKVVGDPFKSAGRFYSIQAANSALNSNHPDWTTVKSDEEQIAGFSVFGAPLSISSSCTPATTTLSILKTSSDLGSFDTSDLYRNNRFYVYNHAGGPLNVHLAWSGGSTADLDLYVYNTGYVFGDTTTAVGYDAAESTATSGSATVSATPPAGKYMINVMAYTGLYGSNGTRTTTFSLTVNGVRACPH